MIVRHRESGVVGVTMPTLVAGDVLTITFDGHKGSHLLPQKAWHEYEVLGPYTAEADVQGCGFVGGAQACVFAGVDERGLTCFRFSEIHRTLELKRTNAKRKPVRLFPDCKLTS